MRQNASKNFIMRPKFFNILFNVNRPNGRHKKYRFRLEKFSEPARALKTLQGTKNFSPQQSLKIKKVKKIGKVEFTSTVKPI